MWGGAKDMPDEREELLTWCLVKQLITGDYDIFFRISALRNATFGSLFLKNLFCPTPNILPMTSK